MYMVCVVCVCVCAHTYVCIMCVCVCVCVCLCCERGSVCRHGVSACVKLDTTRMDAYAAAYPDVMYVYACVCVCVYACMCIDCDGAYATS